MGVKTDGNAKAMYVAGDHDSILKLFKSVDAVVLKITGLPTIELEESKIRESSPVVGDTLNRKAS